MVSALPITALDWDRVMDITPCQQSRPIESHSGAWETFLMGHITTSFMYCYIHPRNRQVCWIITPDVRLIQLISSADKHIAKILFERWRGPPNIMGPGKTFPSFHPLSMGPTQSTSPVKLMHCCNFIPGNLHWFKCQTFSKAAAERQ